MPGLPEKMVSMLFTVRRAWELSGQVFPTSAGRVSGAVGGGVC